MVGDQGSEAPPAASIVVPTVGNFALLERLMRAVALQTLPRDRFELIVVVDGGSDDSRRQVEALGGDLPLLCLTQPRGGRASACNAGLAASRGSVVVFLDDDMEPVPEWLEAHLAAHGDARRRCVMGAAPIPVGHRSGPLEVWMSRGFDAHNAKLAQPDHVFVLRDFYTGNTSIGREALLEVGGFDQEFRVYGHEDLELCVRLREAGIELRFEPAALAWQDYHKNFPAFARDTMNAGRTAVLLAEKHPRVAPEIVLYRGGRRIWRTVNACLLFAARHSVPVARLVVALESVLARLIPARLSRFYVCTSDYFFWAGVQEADRRGRRVFSSTP